jgi:hypothetical protein
LRSRSAPEHVRVRLLAGERRQRPVEELHDEERMVRAELAKKEASFRSPCRRIRQRLRNRTAVGTAYSAA